LDLRYEVLTPPEKIPEKTRETEKEVSARHRFVALICDDRVFGCNAERGYRLAYTVLLYVYR